MAVSLKKRHTNKQRNNQLKRILIETERLFLRELEDTDENDLFEMDSDPEVHLYIENNLVKSIAEIKKNN